MAAQANITVFDGASTPVSHTLVASGVRMQKDGSSYAIWREGLATVPLRAQVRIEQKSREFPTGVIENRTDVSVPVLESISGQNAAGYTAAPKIAFEDKSSYVSYNHPRSTIASRRICKQILMNLLNNVSTSVTPVSAGVVDELHVQQIFAS